MADRNGPCRNLKEDGPEPHRRAADAPINADETLPKSRDKVKNKSRTTELEPALRDLQLPRRTLSRQAIGQQVF
jgi:hypothetical protein